MSGPAVEAAPRRAAFQALKSTPPGFDDISWKIRILKRSALQAKRSLSETLFKRSAPKAQRSHYGAKRQW